MQNGRLHLVATISMMVAGLEYKTVSHLGFSGEAVLSESKCIHSQVKTLPIATSTTLFNVSSPNCTHAEL